MEIQCKETNAKTIRVEPPGKRTWVSGTGIHWTEEVEHPATVHVINNAQSTHTDCYAINRGPECPELLKGGTYE